MMETLLNPRFRVATRIGRRFIATTAVALVCMFSAIPSCRAASPQGQLTVTATVITSVSLVTDISGEQRLVVANAPDPADNVSWFRVTAKNQNTAAAREPLTTTSAAIKPSGKGTRKQHPRQQGF